MTRREKSHTLAADLLPELPERIRDLVEGEPFAVLATQGDAQPYGSVIALAVSADLTQAAFCTSRATRKYSLLERIPVYLNRDETIGIKGAAIHAWLRLTADRDGPPRS